MGSALNLLAVVVGEQGDYLTVIFRYSFFDTGLISHVHMFALFYHLVLACTTHGKVLWVSLERAASSNLCVPSNYYLPVTRSEPSSPHSPWTFE